MKTNKEQALEHVRSVCPELSEVSFGCWIECEFTKERRQLIDDLDSSGNAYTPNNLEVVNTFEIIGHTPHLEHWLRALGDNVNGCQWQVHNGRFIVYLSGGDTCIYLDKEGQPLYEADYKAYCNIVGI